MIRRINSILDIDNIISNIENNEEIDTKNLIIKKEQQKKDSKTEIKNIENYDEKTILFDKKEFNNFSREKLYQRNYNIKRIIYKKNNIQIDKL